jgi:copper(I)-binding protein/uncharacterized protein YcnI
MGKTTHTPAIAAGLVAAAAGLLTGSLLAAGNASAHVTLADGRAAPGAYFTSFFRVGHGCHGSATVALRVEMPEGIVTARPQPKPGWTIAIERAPLSPPAKGEGGKPVTERVAAITWRGGPLPDEDWDQFGFMAKLPDHAGKLYFPAIQTCEQGEERWVETAAEPGAHLSHPAPVLEIAEGGGTDDMAGMDMSGMDMGGAAKGEGAAAPARVHASGRHSAAQAGVRRSIAVLNAWIPVPPGGAPTAAGYLTIRNDGPAPDTLLGGATPEARSLTIHSMSMADGVMRMRPVSGGLALPPGRITALSTSGGYHLMLTGLSHPLKAGDKVRATLRFAHAGDVAVTFVVKPAG